MPNPIPGGWFAGTDPNAIDAFLDAYVKGRFAFSPPKAMIVHTFDDETKVATGHQLLIPECSGVGLRYPHADERKHGGHVSDIEPLMHQPDAKTWYVICNSQPDLRATITAGAQLTDERRHSWSAQIRYGPYAQFVSAFTVPGSRFDQAERALPLAALEAFAIGERLIPLQYRLQQRFGDRERPPGWNRFLLDEIENESS